MSDDLAISVEKISKAYRIWESPSARLTAPILETAAIFFPQKPGQWLRRKAAGSYRDFWALKDVSFAVRKGESVGIIGRNGSGKSTLLQIIAGTLQPSEGRVRVHGRVAALLELGSGFNPEFTGRENVYLNGTVLGLTRQQVEERFDRIAAFADIGDFIDQPVKTYSSGMSIRLAFAVQTAIDPEVLIVDEALSVGDAPFQAKCFSRIRNLMERGTSILLVSHDIGTIRTFSQSATWLHRGRAQAQGEVKNVCDAYQRECWRAAGVQISEELKSGPVPSHPQGLPTDWNDTGEFEKHANENRHGDGPVQIRNVFLKNSAGTRTNSFRYDEKVHACYELVCAKGYRGLFQVGFAIKTPQGKEVISASDRTHNIQLDLPPGGRARLKLVTTLPLVSGPYYLTTSIHSFPEDGRFSHGTYDFLRSCVMDRVEYAVFLNIEPQPNLGIYGPVHAEAELQLINPSVAS